MGVIDGLQKMLGLKRDASEAPVESRQEEKKRQYSTYACPFCGQGVFTFIQQTQATGGRHDGTHLTLLCENCGARGPLADTHEECVEKWNRPALKYNSLIDRMHAIEGERDELKRKLEKKDGLDDLIEKCLDSSSFFQWRTVSIPRRSRPGRSSTKAGCPGVDRSRRKR